MLIFFSLPAVGLPYRIGGCLFVASGRSSIKKSGRNTIILSSFLLVFFNYKIIIQLTNFFNITVFFMVTGLSPPFCVASGARIAQQLQVSVSLVKPWNFLFVGGFPSGLLRVGMLLPVTLRL